MDDKTFIASYVAQETQRINERLKEMVRNPAVPTEEEKNSIIADIETTLRRLQSALSQINVDAEAEEAEDEEEQYHELN